MQQHHGHDHAQAHHGTDSRRALTLALGLTLGFAAIEAIGGLLSGSLALLGDAGHMVTDSAALGLAAVAAWLAKRPPSRRHSYGLGRVETLAALFNAVLMIGLVAAISAAAVGRLLEPRPVQAGVVTWVALVGLCINIGAAWLLMGGRGNINVRAALLHVMGDLLGSVAALVSGVVILYTGWTLIDPILALFIVLLILLSSLQVLREVLRTLLEGVPAHLDLAEVGQAMAETEGVIEVHDLHIWSLSGERTALSAHVVLQRIDDWEPVLGRLRHLLEHRFAVRHVTLQPEPIETIVQLRR
ncbi:cation diffusion facilitator family transporter [Thiorhodococcus minor]|uniref:Cation transporter n=1 Tax=Thiorhodococcus minor TaxID=57489 RepID=A0A6M0JZW5_9GAMM|nr:cation diffusion facilitator family transporter [Thiorhodococcus minor]NEV62604.1 cation transporter [Thiorhodococcus minor]